MIFNSVTFNTLYAISFIGAAYASPAKHVIKMSVVVDDYYELNFLGDWYAGPVNDGPIHSWQQVRDYTKTVTGDGPFLITMRAYDFGGSTGFIGAVSVDGVPYSATGRSNNKFKMTNTPPSEGWDTSVTYPDSQWTLQTTPDCNGGEDGTGKLNPASLDDRIAEQNPRPVWIPDCHSKLSISASSPDRMWIRLVISFPQNSPYISKRGSGYGISAPNRVAYAASDSHMLPSIHGNTQQFPIGVSYNQQNSYFSSTPQAVQPPRYGTPAPPKYGFPSVANQKFTYDRPQPNAYVAPNPYVVKPSQYGTPAPPKYGFPFIANQKFTYDRPQPNAYVAPDPYVAPKPYVAPPPPIVPVVPVVPVIRPEDIKHTIGIALAVDDMMDVFIAGENFKGPTDSPDSPSWRKIMKFQKVVTGTGPFLIALRGQDIGFVAGLFAVVSFDGVVVSSTATSSNKFRMSQEVSDPNWNLDPKFFEGRFFAQTTDVCRNENFAWKDLLPGWDKLSNYQNARAMWYPNCKNTGSYAKPKSMYFRMTLNAYTP
ncbi:hypothetical protein BASA60_001443 [Batrachochytrium salamandrivorans]|nr:hypothetical protein BASA60_001443 [Batrachochytrium salamandrivorans]